MTAAGQGGRCPPDVVLMLRALGLGDFLTGVPAYRAIRRAFPAARTVLAAPADLAGLAPLTGAIDRVLAVGELEPIPWRGPPPAVAIDLHGRGPASHRLVADLGPGRLIVFGGPHGGGYLGPGWRAGEHEVARWCRLCAESGIPADPGDLALARPEPAEHAAAILRGNPGYGGPRCGSARGLKPAGAPTIVHPGAASGSRRWPATRFAGVAARLARSGSPVLITASAGEHRLASRIADLAGLPPGSLACGLPLVDLASLVAGARLVISGDTGISHLAFAYRRPSVTLYGPTPPAEWGPPAHPRHQVLWPAQPGYRGDPHGQVVDPVLAAIREPEVLAAAMLALDADACHPGPAVRNSRCNSTP